ncbi:MAG: cysteine methyltransferase [Acidiferrobacteraceae bacterium]|jgi:methylated-DNA-protein-cysteine methyltransferase-like protein|nr:cysteine methyltransferase [Acidiferrobacteraceae bacterium]HIE75406.1 cysteine methyltransferase [Gammaproteobacteria bacterium]MBT3974439.1 cysteine methyltransferase [Acidiferrobacteraceae bacterium]MBT4394825.1 cysteine methyltransferase [Acidiferrobacteraceae bacterium]MBT4404793.1 cysteine methyltransferase [Acidiferrobacteraceae bacterium]
MGGGIYKVIYTLVQAVPFGQVATYGQIARLAGCGARQVGYAMAAVKAPDIPWHRVVNSRGAVSTRSVGAPDPEQRRRLVEEGVLFDTFGRVNLAVFRWPGPDGSWWIEKGMEPPLLMPTPSNN